MVKPSASAGASDALSDYRRKRDFSKTPEPSGGRVKKGEALSFVIQKHAASHLHYDFRLELDGTLKSWAVPKGPSLDPTDKRMAVHVEDHPISYGGFEGTIPPGQYGAGHVIVWDRGGWKPVGDPHKGLAEGHLKFELDGEKLHGRWALVRMRKRSGERRESWLLIKEKDEHARPAMEYSVVDELPDSVLSDDRITDDDVRKPKARAGRRKLVAEPAKPAKPKPARGRSKGEGEGRPDAAPPPETLQPQLATLVDEAPKGGEWLYEMKFDGYRLLARVDGDDVRLFTRNGNDWTSRMPGLVEAVRGLGLTSAWIDGEIVVRDAKGAPSFQLLQNAFESSRVGNIEYFVFDLPFCEGKDLRRVALEERRQVLKAIVTARTVPQVKFSEAFEADVEELLANACKLGVEGLIGKRRDSPYVPRRSADWIKLKCARRQEFVVCGYTDPKGTRTGLGALLLGVHDEQGQLRYAGNVGTGFDQKTLQSLKRRLVRLETKASPFAERLAGVKGHWVKPELVAEVSFSEWTAEGRVRHAVFQGLREDKPPQGIGREAPEKAAPAKARTAAEAGLPAKLKVTHGDRVVDPGTGFTKLELIAHYAKVADLMLPHLKGRPTSIVRAPEGIGGELFFQKHAEAAAIPGVNLLDTALDPGHAPLLEVPSAEALLNAAQMNTIEFHTWNATKRVIEKPDRMTFDLDPGEGVAWPLVQEGAQLLHAFLDELGLVSFLKSSGGKGLHVVVPLVPRLDWDTVKDFSQAVVEHMARVVPQRFVAKSGPRNRRGRIFIDYLRNGRGATTVAAWSARARPGMGVSVPLAWEELKALESGAHWNVGNIEDRLDVGNEPWADYEDARQGLSGAMKKLGVRK